MPNTDDWPIRANFQKKYCPYGVRICADTFDEIKEYEDCTTVSDPGTDEIWVEIETREGTLTALWGDWIMEDSEGCHYPIADEEIGKTYEPIEKANHPHA